MNAESAIGGVTALVGLLGAVAGLLQIIKSMRAKGEAAGPALVSGDVDDHLIDELVKARVELEMMRRKSPDVP